MSESPGVEIQAKSLVSRNHECDQTPGLPQIGAAEDVAALIFLIAIQVVRGKPANGLLCVEIDFVLDSC